MSGIQMNLLRDGGAHSPNTEGCVEPMSDKQCRFSHVRIIESNDARVVVHWRYAPVDVKYEHSFIDPKTGWFDWVDEYYIIYPNAVGIREITVQSNGLDKWIEFQEAILHCKKSSDLELKLEASEESPVINPVFVIKNWGDKNAELTIDGKKIERGDNFRYGIERTLDSTDLIVWIKTESTKLVTIKLAQI